MKEEEFEQVFPVRQMTDGFVLAQSLTPKWAGKKLDITFFELMKMMKSFGEIMKEMKNEAVIASELDGHLNDPKWVDFLQNETGLKAEGCSFNVQGNAKGMNYTQTCTAQGLKMSHFGELPDVVFQKLLKNAKKPEVADFSATRCGFHKNSQILTV